VLEVFLEAGLGDRIGQVLDEYLEPFSFGHDEQRQRRVVGLKRRRRGGLRTDGKSKELKSSIWRQLSGRSTRGAVVSPRFRLTG
jgi:hypothetical protein